MAKGMYIGVNGVARKIKKAYIGVNGVARKIKKAYIGVNGVARCIFGGAELVNFGIVDDAIGTPRYRLAATPVGCYALFGGGMQYSNSVETTRVDCIDPELTSTTTYGLAQARFGLAATTVNGYALFAGGHKDSSSTNYSTVDIYTEDLMHTSATTSLSQGRYDLTATTVGDYALFAGGSRVTSSGAWTHYSTVDVYDSNLTRSNPTDLLVDARGSLAAATVGEYAIFAGGYTTTHGYYDTIDVYDEWLTKISTTIKLSVARSDLGGTPVGNYALFGGGYGDGGECRAVDAYSSDLVASILTEFSGRMDSPAATSVDNYALFACRSNVQAYDDALSQASLLRLSVSRSGLAATTLSDGETAYALFGGGNKTHTSADVYTTQ